MKHFGIEVKKVKYSLKLVRDEFAVINTHPSLMKFDFLVKEGAYANDEGTEYKLEWCEKYRKICLKNFDLNMKYFSLLDGKDFKTAVDGFLERHNGFINVEDLKEYNGSVGYYFMILGEYKQAYIGQSYDICKRIRQHWSKTKQFDRTLLPMYAAEKSCFSIDFFRALDTTEIYIWEKPLDDKTEAELIADFPRQYCTNRIGGNISDLIGAVSTMNKRKLD